MYLQRGDVAVSENRWRDAERAYREVMRFDAESEVAKERLADLTRNEAEWHFDRGQKHLRAGRPIDAIAAFEKTLSVRQDHPRAAMGLAEARAERARRVERAAAAHQRGLDARRRGDYEAALTEFAEAAELDPLHPSAGREYAATEERFVDLCIEEGDAAMEERRFAPALDAYRKASSRDASRPHLARRIELAERELEAAEWLSKGRTALAERNWQGAYECYDRARCLTSDPDYFVADYNRARTQYAKFCYRQVRRRSATVASTRRSPSIVRFWSSTPLRRRRRSLCRSRHPSRHRGGGVRRRLPRAAGGRSRVGARSSSAV